MEKFLSLLVNDRLEKEEFGPVHEVFNTLGTTYEQSTAINDAEFGDGLLSFCGFPILWPFIYNFPVKSDDVIISTFPKSGTTWTQQIVYLIMTGDFEKGKSIPIDERIPFMEMPQPNKQHKMIEFSEMETPRILKTHLPANLLPKDWAKGRMIYVYRNAKDVAVSFYHHSVRSAQGSFPFDFTEYARHFINGKVKFGPYHQNLLGYRELFKKYGDQILFLRYEDMKMAPREHVVKIANFLGKTLSDEMIDRICKETSFETMKDNKAVNYTANMNCEALPKFMRKGVVGDWKNHFTDQKLLEDFEHYIHSNLPKELIFETN